MDTLQQLKDELGYEFNVTKKFFKAFPEDNTDFAPHEKSMKLMILADHIVAIFGWPVAILNTSELDIGEADESEKVENREQLENVLDKEYKASITALEQTSEADLEPSWALTMNGQKLMEWTIITRVA